VREITTSLERASADGATAEERAWLDPILLGMRRREEGHIPGRPRGRPPGELVVAYWRLVFRFGQAKRMFERGQGTAAQRCAQMWDAFELQALAVGCPKVVAAFLARVRETPKAFTPERFARGVCARVWGLSEERVRKIISTYRLA
jgi:hypothetical protein